MEKLVSQEHHFWKSKKVLITGHTGFKGSWLTLLLKSLGTEVFGYSLEPEQSPSLFYDLFSDSLALDKTHHKIGDINNTKKLDDFISKSKPEIVFHLAAQPLVRKSYLDPLGTWKTNVIGTINLLESLKKSNLNCSVVIITTDKVYKNKEWPYGYRENDILGGHDPYSASKAATELAIDSWRSSFCGESKHQTNMIKIASARSGNVLGGGDWSEDRIIPDCIRSLQSKKTIIIRNPKAIRPWQHVLDPLNGYLILAKALNESPEFFSSSYNFGPLTTDNFTVEKTVKTLLKYWEGKYKLHEDQDSFHEANTLNLQIYKSIQQLKWLPKWDFETTLRHTMNWYVSYYQGKSALELTLKDINTFLRK